MPLAGRAGGVRLTRNGLTFCVCAADVDGCRNIAFNLFDNEYGDALDAAKEEAANAELYARWGDSAEAAGAGDPELRGFLCGCRLAGDRVATPRL